MKLEGEFSEGYYIAPTVIEGLSYNCRTNQEEIFGPVMSILKFKDMDELVERALRDRADPSTWGKVPRNSPCPCGSGKKFKQCHGRIA